MGVIRRKYTEQFKEEAVKLAENVGVTQAAKDLGITSTNISRWRKGPQNAPIKATAASNFSVVEEENLRLKKELRHVYEVNAILKKSLGIFAKDRTPSL